MHAAMITWTLLFIGGVLPTSGTLFTHQDTRIVAPDDEQEDVEVGARVTLVCQSTGPVIWLFMRLPPRLRPGLTMEEAVGFKNNSDEQLWTIRLTIDSAAREDSGQFECRRIDEYFERDTVFLVVWPLNSLDISTESSYQSTTSTIPSIASTFNKDVTTQGDNTIGGELSRAVLHSTVTSRPQSSIQRRQSSSNSSHRLTFPLKSALVSLIFVHILIANQLLPLC